MANRILSAVKSGVSGVQRAYQREKAAVNVRAAKRYRDATTRYQREKVKAGLEQEKLILQRQMYEAQGAVERERAAVKRARLATGRRTFGERAAETGASIGKQLWSGGKQFARGMARMNAEPARRRRVVRKTATVKRTVRRR